MRNHSLSLARAKDDEQRAKEHYLEAHSDAVIQAPNEALRRWGTAIGKAKPEILKALVNSDENVRKARKAWASARETVIKLADENGEGETFALSDVLSALRSDDSALREFQELVEAIEGVRSNLEVTSTEIDSLALSVGEGAEDGVGTFEHISKQQFWRERVAEDAAVYKAHLSTYIFRLKSLLAEVPKEFRRAHSELKLRIEYSEAMRDDCKDFIRVAQMYQFS